MRQIFVVFFTLLSITSNAQKKKAIKLDSSTLLEELNMTVYDKDSTANAVVLYEYANRYPDQSGDGFTTTYYYYRIKILNKASFNLANININLYGGKKIRNIKATTYNLNKTGVISKNSIKEKDVFTIKEGTKWVTKKFTFSNIKVGSVIEYSYTVVSPYTVRDWTFQSNIPKIKSEFDVLIPGRRNYNMRIIGLLKLDSYKPTIDRNCAYLQAKCVAYSFGMDNIPAFKEEEYMLSKKNYISRIVFDLKSVGSNELTNTWKIADKTLKNYFLNNQTSKKSFFKKRLPETILETANKLERAKKVYAFIRNHYTWDERYWGKTELKLRKSFDKKTGSVAEINLSLYNALKAAKIDSYIVMLSTRDNGVPTDLYPIINDFNYLIVKVVIDGKEYFLDASDKYVHFGQVPFKCLNGRARVMDFKNESFWQEITIPKKTDITIKTLLSMDAVGEFSGSLLIKRTGYSASKARQVITESTENSYLESFEDSNANLLVEDYKNYNLTQLENSLTEKLKIKLENEVENLNNIRFNPFIIATKKENPFKLKERNYPIDFGYPSKYTYTASITIPENYEITNLPKQIGLKLPNNGGSLILKTLHKDQKIDVYLKLETNRSIFSPNEYHYLKEFYKQLIEAESSYIQLKKKN
jgi:hypothetical protein